MASNSSAAQSMQTIRRLLTNELRYEHPFLKTEALERMINHVIEYMEESIAREEPAMNRSKSRISFFSLPAELRDEIYELALEIGSGGSKHIDILDETWWKSASYLWKYFARPNRPKRPKWMGYTLSLVSSQVRTESRAVYYGRTRFIIHMRPIMGEERWPGHLRAQLKRIIGPHAKLIKNLRLLTHLTRIQLGNYIWLHFHCPGEKINYDTLKWGPAPRVNQDMLLSFRLLVELGVSPSAISTDRMGIK